MKMRCHNYMEDLVEDSLERFYAEETRYCSCGKCRGDAAAWVLNRLPPKYVVTLKGGAFTKLEALELQFRADVDKEIVNALNRIAKNPRH